MRKDQSQSDCPLILFSGLGADAQVFLPQKIAFPNLIVPDWLSPIAGEGFPAYCARLAAAVDAGRPCFVGGASFGGIVSLEVAKHLNVLGCFLIGSVQGPHQLPRRIRWLRPMAPVVPVIPLSLLQRFAASTIGLCRRGGAKHLAGIASQFSNANVDVLRWSLQQIWRWNSTNKNVVVRHIHGDRDRVFPLSLVEPDEVVVGGGHVISMTHGAKVNEFLRTHMEEIVEAR